ncbi:MAG: hypothetical protein N3D82_02085 [Ignisphaera sp.]|nr:hypothetical protein [Ignisphaera sp.]
MVWLSKRELAYYLILKKRFDKKVFNINEAVGVLSLFGSKSTARKVIKRLKSKGFLEGVGVMTYRIGDGDEVLIKLLSSYIVQRLYRNLKSRGYAVNISKPGQYSTLEIQNCGDNILTELDMIKGLGIHIVCIEDEGK